MQEPRSPSRRWPRWMRTLGPGLTTGAADDDPSGITTYTVAGARFGTSFLWTALITFPLMAAVQMMCARIGMVTGRGLTQALRLKFPAWLVGTFALVLFAANVVNIAANLAGMGDSVRLLAGGPSALYVAAFGIGIGYLTVRLRYVQIAAILKWLSLSLFAYIATALLARPDWGTALRDTFVPAWPATGAHWSMLVAILGTTISPYLFYWQTGQEIEEARAKGQRSIAARQNASARELGDRRLDVVIGTLFSNLIMYFILLTAASTLHRAGNVDITTTQQAAEALRPLAGDLAYALYSLGLVGTGLLAIPTLAGSAAYALGETMGWKCGLDRTFREACPFYGVFLLATGAGIAIALSGVSPIKALVWSGIANGLLAPVLLVAIWLVASDRKVMLGQPSSRLSRAAVALTIVLMTGAAIAMFAT